MAIITQTIFSKRLAIALKLGIPHQVEEYTTVNEALGLSQIVPHQPDVSTAGSELTDPYSPENDTGSFRLRYLIIGNDGHNTIYGESVTAGIPVPIEHSSKDSCLFNMIPLLIRDIEDDLTPTERQKYRLRKVLQVGSVFKVAYFAMVLTSPTSIPDQLIYRVENNQIVGTAPFVPSLEELNPSHPTGDIRNDNTHIAVTVPYNVNLTESELADISDACDIMYGDSRLALVSEIGICTAVEKSVLQRYPISGNQVPQAVASNTYFEAVAMQIDTHVTTVQSISEASTGFNIGLQVGGGTPLYPTASTQSGT